MKQHSAAGVHIKGPGSFWGFDANMYILETLFLLTSILTTKVDKNRALDTSINLRPDMLHLFFNLHEKVML